MNAFNSNFYITAATVIPVLYITLIVQARTVSDMLTRFDRLMSAKIKGESHKTITLVIMTLGFAVAFTIWCVSAAILILGIGGEIAAILALYSQSDSDGVRLFVLVSTILLLVISTIGPALTISTAFARPLTRWIKAFIQVLRTSLSAGSGSGHNDR
jgi:hypothetical protein